MTSDEDNAYVVDSKEDLPDRNSTNYPLALFKFLDQIQVNPDDTLQYHQKLVKQYFTLNTNNRGLLVFHGTGSGKTMLSVAIADVLKSLYKVVILSAKSLQHNFQKEVTKYSELQKKDEVPNNYVYISSNAGNMLDQLSRIGKSKEELEFEKTLEVFNEKIDLENKLIIVDEAQNLFNSIVNGSRNGLGFYNAVMNATNVRLIFLSATPIINDPFEIVPMFNMLHGYRLLPESYDDFYTYYVDTLNSRIKNKEKFKNRIVGLLSYVGDWWNTGGINKPGEVIKRPNFPDQLPTIVEKVPMSTEQFSAYSTARDLESQVKGKRSVTKENMQKPKSNPSSTYRVASRQISNFLLPDTIKVKKIGEYGYVKHIDKLTDEHLTNLDKYSPKMKKIFDNIKKHPGLCVVYSSFVTGEGLRIFSKILMSNGWKEYNKTNKKDPSERVFAFVTGNVSADDRAHILSQFNDKSNQYGGNIDLMLLSGAGAEGLDLRNVMSIHVMEPYWNYGRIVQIIARAIRYKSHDDYEMDKRIVQPYIYLSDYPKDYEFKPTKTKKTLDPTTDVHLYTKSIKSKRLNESFYAAMIEASIDCKIHIKGSPDEVKKKIDCLMCTPTNEKLFHPDPILDLKLSNTCSRPVQESINAEEIQYQGQTYYYTKSPDGTIFIFEYKKNLDAYTEMNRTHPHYNALIEQLG
jgi:superfamily II DNA or RNA helicase